jgi:3',5'-cyclic AMP phosphodiesterase CpdA
LRKIIHLSDLHFGRVDPDVVSPLLEAIQAERPDVTVVSGDFVQNGTRREFEQARQFVQQLPGQRILVPGNHDMPFTNLFWRFATGLRLYKEYITAEMEPFWSDEEVAILGISTARRWPIRGGRIHETQVRSVEQKLCALSPGITKILVTHHPFDLGPAYGRRQLVGRARMAMTRLAGSIDILLAGHMHQSHAGHTAVRYRLQGKSAIFVQAGTATSTRGRGEPNAFNLLRIEPAGLVVELHQWQRLQRQFRCVSSESFALWRDKAECQRV